MRAPSPSLAQVVAHDRRPLPGDPQDARRYVNLWTEPEALGGEEVRAFVLILRTRGCYWADIKGCTMCGYARDTLGRSATEEEIAQQVRSALRNYRDEPYVKIYTSGSFFDSREVPSRARREVARAFRGRARRLLVESLPEFLSEEELRDLREEFSGEVEVALGLESTQEEVLRHAVGKGEHVTHYLEGAALLRRAGVHPKAYLLLKPPYLTEREAIEDTVESVRRAAEHFETLSINPVHIQGGTVTEHLFRRGLYRPPWLWSLKEVLERARPALPSSVRLVSFPTSGGNQRGVHNCGRCDADLLRAVQEASLRQDLEPLQGVPHCSCRAVWEWQSRLEASAPEV
jgi:radical SAM enzyme (TIGR01210 family)